MQGEIQEVVVVVVAAISNFNIAYDSYYHSTLVLLVVSFCASTY